jgi:SAM-dependent methyltransferase
MKHRNCPSCFSNHIEDFFSVPDAPIHSLVISKTYEEAMSIPRKKIDLAFCNNCGFIFNSSFDTSIDYYTHGYEDQQGFSPTFVKFITGITKNFIDRYHLFNKDIIEIGCGKGDFISLISELGQNRGIGIDPAWVRGRTDPSANVRFIKEFYTEKHGEFRADSIVCRHTLEHIHGTGEFMRIIRNSLNGNGNAILFFEIPSIVRILKIQAFWDIFYEHCTYFSPGSLARLFRLHNFEVLDMYIEYDNQYLFVEARPSEDPTKNIHPLEESVEALKALTVEFVTKIKVQLNEWRNLLQKFKENQERVVVWGGGSKSVGFLTHFNDLGIIDHVIDINPHMTGNFIPGIGIQYKKPEFLREYKPGKVIIMNGVYRDEIEKSLEAMRLKPELLCL